MSMMSKSNRTAPIRLPLLLVFFLVTTLVGSVLSFPYLFLVKSIPYIQLACIMSLVFGAVTGLASAWLCKVCKLGNTPTVMIAGAVSAILFQYVKWGMFSSYVFTLWYNGEDQASYFAMLPGFLLNPVALIDAILEINQYGTWSMSDSGTTVNGWMLALIWLAEFVIIFAIYLRMLNGQATKPFIAGENEWAMRQKGNVFLRNFPEAMSAQMISMNPAILLPNVVPASEIGIEPHIEVELFHSKDYSENYINVHSVSYVRQNGQTKKQEKKIARNVEVNREFISALLTSARMSFET